MTSDRAFIFHKSMDESNTVVNVYTLYRHLQQYCSVTNRYVFLRVNPYFSKKVKVICEGKGQKSGSQFSKQWPLQGHLRFPTTPCFSWPR